MKFYFISLLSGAHTGKTIEASTRQDAENKALNTGYNIYDDYMLTTDAPGAIPFTQRQIHFNNL